MAQKLAGLNTYGLCDWLSKKGLHDFVSHIQAWNYDGQMLVALTEDQILSLEISERSRRKLLKAIYPNSPAITTLAGGNSGLLSRFRKAKNGQSNASASSSARDGSALDEEYYDDDDEWDDDEFEDDVVEENGHSDNTQYPQDTSFDQVTQQLSTAGIGSQDHSHNSHGSHLSPSHDAPLPALPSENGHSARPGTAPKPAAKPTTAGSSHWSSNSSAGPSQPSTVSELRSTFNPHPAAVPNQSSSSAATRRAVSSAALPTPSTAPSTSNKFNRSMSHGSQSSATTDMMTQEWYNPNMDRRAAEGNLQQAEQDGSFVVRNSSKCPGEYSLSLIFHGHVRHLRIRRRADNMFALGELKDGEKFFLTVTELVLYHRSDPITLQSGGVTCLTQSCGK